MKPRKPLKRPRRQRKTPLAALKRKLWTLFSAYVKERDGAVCFSCGASGLEGSGWHAGHMFTAGAHSLIRYHPQNVHSQCFRCNINLGGNGAAYAQAYLSTYGEASFMQLSREARISKQWKAYEIEELVQALKRGGADYETLFFERHLSTAPVTVAQAGSIE